MMRRNKKPSRHVFVYARHLFIHNILSPLYNLEQNYYKACIRYILDYVITNMVIQR